MNETLQLFPDIVGQDRAKKKLAFFHRGYNASSIIPHLMFIAPKGCGKTTMAKAMAKQLKGSDKPIKTFLEINCSTIKNLKQFFNQIVIPHVNQKECTILFDEASELPKDVTMALLTILNPNEENRTEFAFEDYVVNARSFSAEEMRIIKDQLDGSWTMDKYNLSKREREEFLWKLK